QADHLLRDPLAHRRAAFGHRKTPVRLLTVERDRIVDRGRNALRIDRCRKRIALTGGEADGVLRPNRCGPRGEPRDARDIGETGGISARYALTRHQLVRKDLQFLDQHGRLDRIETPIQTDAYAIILVTALPMDPEAAHHLRELLILGEDGAAIAIAAKRLRGKEAGRGCRRESTEAAVLVGRTEGLGSIIENEQAL